jgi:hypothetical protein
MKRSPVSRNTTRHGKAAAVAMIHALGRIGGEPGRFRGNPGYGERGERERTTAVLRDYLVGYGTAPARAKAGFLWIVGEFFVCSLVCGVPNAEDLSNPGNRNMGRALSTSERKAHARAWLKGGDHGSV